MPMRIHRSDADPHLAEADLLAVGLFEGAETAGPIAALDRALGGHLRAHLKEDGYAAKEGATLVMHAHGKLRVRKVALVGLGARKGFGPARMRSAAARAAKLAAASKAARLALWLPTDAAVAASDAAKAIAEGCRLGVYRFGRYRKDAAVRLEEVDVLGPLKLASRAAEAAFAMGQLFADATSAARDLVNTPAQDMTPLHMAEEARRLAAPGSRISCTVYGREELKAMGCGGILAVAQGSEHPPAMAHLTYRPTGKARRRVVLVGKGVTFDSGGLSIKPAEAMMDMRIDMAGAAAVLGVFAALPKLRLPIEVHGVAAFVENMPSGTAIRPGDIVRTMSGKTIEILNTDAEGRVTLADALHYGAALKPDLMVDLATLTGAVMVALGQDVSGLMTDDERLADRLRRASEDSGEPLWRLPLYAPYAELVKSRHADLKNIGGGRYAGALTAGLFLKEFVPPNLPWAHLDIAGPAYNEKDYSDERSWGASGHGARLLLEFLKKL